MPTALQLLPVNSNLRVRSILFVACSICPRAHVQFRAGEPLYSWRNLFGKVDAYARHIQALEDQAQKLGASTGCMKTSLASAMCLWSETECKSLRHKAEKFEAIGVLGCESAALTVKRTVPDKLAIPLAKTVGIANFTLRSRFFFTVDIVAGAIVETGESEPRVLAVNVGTPIDDPSCSES